MSPKPTKISGRMHHFRFALAALAAIVPPSACKEQTGEKAVPDAGGEKTFSEDLAFLSAHTAVKVRSCPETGAQVALAAAWQGRVMTSTSCGAGDPSYGWLGYDAIEDGILPEAERTGLQKHIHVFGGEERFWLGPEGGQFALFFQPGNRTPHLAHGPLQRSP